MILANSAVYDDWTDESSLSEWEDDLDLATGQPFSIEKSSLDVLVDMLIADESLDSINGYIAEHQLGERRYHGNMDITSLSALYCHRALLEERVGSLGDPGKLRDLALLSISAPRNISDERICACLESLRVGIGLRIENPNSTPLCVAVTHGRRLVVETLLKQFLSDDAVNETDDCEWPPLAYAIQRGDRILVELLLRNGASLSFRTKDGHNVLTLSKPRRPMRYMFDRLVRCGQYQRAVSPGLNTVLSSLNLSHLSGTLQSQGITDLSVLKLMSDRSLIEAGIESAEDRKSLLSFFADESRRCVSNEEWRELLRNIEFHIRYIGNSVDMISRVMRQTQYIFRDSEHQSFVVCLLNKLIKELGKLKAAVNHEK